MNIYQLIESLICYGLEKNLLEEEDCIYSRNKILQILDLDEYQEQDFSNFEKKNIDHIKILDGILEWAYKNKVLKSMSCEFSDVLDSRLMDAIMPRPSEIKNKFWKLYNENPKKAIDYYYELSKSSHYIRMDRIQKNKNWTVDSEYGEIEISINLSKPEKDPKLIALASKQESVKYPKCLLCRENEGYLGRIDHPGRANHRLIKIDLNKETWFFQYSPYVYFNEHSIVLKEDHVPMRITRDTFQRLLDFVDLFSQYFIGSNADLPIVGGSMLSHDHYQSGRYKFPMEKASVTFTTRLDDQISMSVLNWPLSVIRINGKDKNKIIDCCEELRLYWKEYNDFENNIYAYTNDTPHNTITPIVRKNKDEYEVDIVLRNNKTNELYPDGIFHPHRDVHPVKKENIGLIEVMGLAILPSRLDIVIQKLSKSLKDGDSKLDTDSNLELRGFEEIFIRLKDGFEYRDKLDVEDFIKGEIGKIFIKGLKDCGVFKDNENTGEFLNRFCLNRRN